MKKSTQHSEWENIQGFDPIKGEYVRLDCDAWLESYGIREEGKRRGKQNQPSSEATSPDEIYKKIENWVGKRTLDCKDEVEKYIRGQKNVLYEICSTWEKENPVIKLRQIVEQGCQDLKLTANQSLGDIDHQRAEFEESARDLKHFRESHRLSRVADYPDSQFAHWLWIPVFMVIETFAGANLLGSVSPGGVSEGWTVAFVLTVVNVILGIGAGQMWRRTNLQGARTQVFAYLSSIFFTVVALFWNGVAGHVRDVYVRAEKTGELESLNQAFAAAWHTMIDRPLPWESLPSTGLALVGIFVFAFTTYKSYTADDPFPGYGVKHRKAKALRHRYQDWLNDALTELKFVRDKVNVDIEEIKDRYEMDRALWKATLDKLKHAKDGYTPNLRQYNKDLAYLIAAYRDANLATRTTPPPPFFSMEPTINEEVLQTPELDVPNPPEWGDIPKEAEAGFKQVKEAYDELLPRYKMPDHVVDDYEEEGGSS